MLPALVGFGHVARSFRIPPRIGVAVLGFVVVANVVLITRSLANRLPSGRAAIELALVWALAGVAAMLLWRAWRAGCRNCVQSEVPLA
jgi:hypothetical protein